MVIDWQAGPAEATPQKDPWQQSRQAETRQAMLLLKRVLMSVLAEKGTDLPSGPNGPLVRMVDQEIVRKEFYARTAADGTPAQKKEFRQKRFKRALNRAEEMQLIGNQRLYSQIRGVTFCTGHRCDDVTAPHRLHPSLAIPNKTRVLLKQLYRRT